MDLDPIRQQFDSFLKRLPDLSHARAFPDVRWMEISSVLQQQLDAGLDPEQIRQIEFVGETLDMASVLRLRRRILTNNVASN